MADRRQQRRRAPVDCEVCGRPAKLREYVPAWGEVVRRIYHADDGTPAGAEHCTRARAGEEPR